MYPGWSWHKDTSPCPSMSMSIKDLPLLAGNISKNLISFVKYYILTSSFVPILPLPSFLGLPGYALASVYIPTRSHVF